MDRDFFILAQIKFGDQICNYTVSSKESELAGTLYSMTQSVIGWPISIAGFVPKEAIVPETKDDEKLFTEEDRKYWAESICSVGDFQYDVKMALEDFVKDERSIELPKA